MPWAAPLACWSPACCVLRTARTMWRCMHSRGLCNAGGPPRPRGRIWPGRRPAAACLLCHLACRPPSPQIPTSRQPRSCWRSSGARCAAAAAPRPLQQLLPAHPALHHAQALPPVQPPTPPTTTRTAQTAQTQLPPLPAPRLVCRRRALAPRSSPWPPACCSWSRAFPTRRSPPMCRRKSGMSGSEWGCRLPAGRLPASAPKAPLEHRDAVPASLIDTVSMHCTHASC